jgi:hypothetical protein
MESSIYFGDITVQPEESKKLYDAVVNLSSAISETVYAC